MRKALVFCSVLPLSAMLISATTQIPSFALEAGRGGLVGRILDPSGAAVSGATVSATNTVTHAQVSATTDMTGMYTINGLVAGSYTVVIARPGFATFTKTGINLLTDQFLTIDGTLSLSSDSQSVTVTGDDLHGATPAPTQQQVFESDQTIRVIDRKQMDMVGPVAGAAQIISTAPGAQVTGYGNTGSTKYTITINGINQGWVGYGGYSGQGSLGVTFDGIPVVDPATQLWQSPTIPQTDMIQNTSVVYGPGDPASRWYTNVGGAVEFTPVQPTREPHASVIGTYGSYNQKNIETNLNTGLYHGWSGLLSFGTGSGDDFRQAPDGFTNPGKNLAVLGKTIKESGDNSFEFGGYYAHGAGYRSQLIPLVANPGITINGQGAGQEYSQKTSGYYSTLPYSSYNKYDSNDMVLIYARQNMKLDATTSLQNQEWFMRIDRTHRRINDIFALNSNSAAQEQEWNDPHTNTVGERLLLTKHLPLNDIIAGGYYIHSDYNSRNIFFDPSLGGGKKTVNIGGKIRSTDFTQDDFAVTLQDDIHPLSFVHITLGIRFVGFRTTFADAARQDFQLATGVVLNTSCRYIPNDGTAGNTTDQGSCPNARENRTAIEPSASANITARPWLSLYGGYLETTRAPQLGGGGGLFQSVDPTSYHLARQRYYEAGFKTHLDGTGLLNSFLAGAEYYHQNFANQEIDVTLASGDTISSNGTSSYHGVNAFVDDDPIGKLHVFANGSLERAVYTSYTVVVNPNGSPGLNYNGVAVPYIPSSLANAGAYYEIHPYGSLVVQPTASFQFSGRQHIFDNTLGAPSQQTMPSYETVNLGLSVPFRRFNASLSALNILNKSYNEYEYISSGSYFNTAGNSALTPSDQSGYTNAYPAAPFTVFGSVSAHF